MNYFISISIIISICLNSYEVYKIYIVNTFLWYKLTFLGVDFKVYYNTLVHSLSLPMLLNYWVKFWTNSIKHFWNNRPVRLPTLRFSYTHFLTVAILRFFKKGINFVITIAFCNDTAYTRVFWFDNWLVWRYSSWSAHENTWMLRTSFTASWKTNNHSSSCTLQMEHHFILPIYIMYLKQYNYVMYQTCIIT